MAQLKFSVVVPCYNDGTYLSETIDSVKKQTSKEWELIVVDDGSDQITTIEALKRIETDLDVRLIRVTHQGVSGARNIGIEKSKGEYILTLDADDLIDPTYLEKAQLYFSQNSKRNIFYTRAKFFGAIESSWNLPRFELKSFAIENCIYATAVFAKDLWVDVQGYRENMSAGLEDYDFWIRAIAKGYQPYLFEEELFSYRVKPNSRTVRLSRSSQEIEMQNKLVENNLEFFSRPEILVEIYRQMHLSRTKLRRIERTLVWRLLLKHLVKFEWFLRRKRACLLGRGDLF